ncbi:MAG TPA: hypothetical protein VFF80_05655, partial [Bacillota bacterium]|nr:hypothetical protein [Bacillota bacterium]
MLNGFTPLYQTEQMTQLTRAVHAQRGPVSLYGLSDTAQKSLHVALLAAEELPFLLVSYGHNQAQNLFDDITGLLPEKRIGFFPANESFFYDSAAASRDLSNQRLQVLLDLLNHKLDGVVTDIEALMLPLLPPDIMTSRQLCIHIGDHLDLKSLMESLVAQGYERVVTVD